MFDNAYFLSLVAMSCVYAGSRTLLALSEQGYAPKCFNYVDKAGRPLPAILSVIAFYPIAYASTCLHIHLLVNSVLILHTAVNEDVGDQIFNWLLALSGLSTIITWLSINVAHLRFRKAWRVQGHSLDELPFRALGGIWGSWFAAIILVLVLIAQFYVVRIFCFDFQRANGCANGVLQAIWPIGGQPGGAAAAESFFLAYLAMPIIILFYIAGIWWKRTTPRKASSIDLVSGRKVWATPEELEPGRQAIRELPMYKWVPWALFGVSHSLFLHSIHTTQAGVDHVLCATGLRPQMKKKTHCRLLSSKHCNRSVYIKHMFTSLIRIAPFLCIYNSSLFTIISFGLVDDVRHQSGACQPQCHYTCQRDGHQCVHNAAPR